MRKIGLFTYLLLFVAFVGAVNYFEVDVKEVVESELFQKALLVGKNGVAVGYEAFASLIEDIK